MSNSINSHTQPLATSTALSKLRLNSMRFLYLITFIGLAPSAWQEIFQSGIADPMVGVAFSFWAALTVLMLLGMRYPLKMLPLLFLQFFYKSIWLVGIGYPLWSSNSLDPVSSELVFANAVGATLGLLIIPWPYAFKHYMKNIYQFSNKEEAI